MPLSHPHQQADLPSSHKDCFGWLLSLLMATRENDSETKSTAVVKARSSDFFQSASAKMSCRGNQVSLTKAGSIAKRLPLKKSLWKHWNWPQRRAEHGTQKLWNNVTPKQQYWALYRAWLVSWTGPTHNAMSEYILCIIRIRVNLEQAPTCI